MASLAKAKDLLRTIRLPLDAAARASGFRDARHLTRAFRQVEHCAPGAWQRAAGTRPARDVQPLEHAKQLLAETDCEIDVIALICGFARPSRLRRAFCEQVRMLPSRWRLRYRKPPRASHRPPKPPVVVRVLGPDGEVEEERTFLTDDGRGTRTVREGEEETDEGDEARDAS